MIRRIIKRMFCLHYWEKTGMSKATLSGVYIEHICMKCGKKIDADINCPPISWID